MPCLTFARFCWVVVVPFSLFLAALIAFAPVIAAVVIALTIALVVKVLKG